METKRFEALAGFDEITVWGHEQVEEDGGVVRAVGEWAGFAARIHSWEEEEEDDGEEEEKTV